MRYFEITSGVRIPVSSEEQAILDKIDGHVKKADLDERDQEIARRMTTRGVINRSRDDDKNIIYTKNKEKIGRT